MTKKRATKSKARFAFFGTAPLAIGVLDELSNAGYEPDLIIAAGDRFDTRKRTVIEPPEKMWARVHSIAVIQPKSDSELLRELKKELQDFFVVASYGKIFSRELLGLPKKGVLNAHPSLLPRLRGPSPIRSAILNDEKKTGVSIMLMDSEMDHGPLLAQKEVAINDWPPRGPILDELLAHEGGKLLTRIIPEWLSGHIEPREQNHDVATYSEKIRKEDGLLDLAGDPHMNLLKIRAFEGWPGTYAFFERPERSAPPASGRRIRVNILDAHIENQKLIIDTVKPEGKKEMRYQELLASGAKPL